MIDKDVFDPDLMELVFTKKPIPDSDEFEYELTSFNLPGEEMIMFIEAELGQEKMNVLNNNKCIFRDEIDEIYYYHTFPKKISGEVGTFLDVGDTVNQNAYETIIKDFDLFKKTLTELIEERNASEKNWQEDLISNLTPFKNEQKEREELIQQYKEIFGGEEAYSELSCQAENIKFALLKTALQMHKQGGHIMHIDAFIRKFVDAIEYAARRDRSSPENRSLEFGLILATRALRH